MTSEPIRVQNKAEAEVKMLIDNIWGVKATDRPKVLKAITTAEAETASASTPISIQFLTFDKEKLTPIILLITKFIPKTMTAKIINFEKKI